MKQLLLNIVLFVLICGIQYGCAKKRDKFPECCPFNINICAKNNNDSIKESEERLFPGLFVNRSFLERQNKSVAIVADRNIIHNITIPADIEGQSRTQRATQCTCCETVFSYTAITTVTYEGEDYAVVQYDDNYQIVTEGHCKVSQCSNHNCVTMSRLVWMLIKIDCSWDPDVRFVPVVIPSHCEC
ncbi:uncharacterized protein [Argopecten irradians]|uniref:uncharacterized protein n=1 Tax=Argopecten irradians TaxID=31199 RepID=UPI00371E0196